MCGDDILIFLVLIIREVVPLFSEFNIKSAIFCFIYSLPPFLGCGNGKYLGINENIYTLGSDMCPELVAIARGRGHEALVCDCLELPYQSCSFDAVISIAVIHHLSTEERRESALREMTRLLRPGGQLLVYVWAMEQTRKKVNGVHDHGIPNPL